MRWKSCCITANRATQADLNYTYSKFQDWTSRAERLATFGGNTLTDKRVMQIALRLEF